MESFIKQIAKKAGLSSDMARVVLETAREYLQQELPPEQFEKVEATLTDERKARRAGRMFARFQRKLQRDDDSAEES